MTRTVKFSPDRKFRYRLTIHFDECRGDFVNFVMLNPSTADEVKNDTTVERCERRARQWGFDGVIITNLFAWRSTDPCQLYLPGDRVGPDNDDEIVDAASKSQLVICAWGGHGHIKGRGEFVRMMLQAERITLYYLRWLEKSKQPGHPLYIPYSQEPVIWK